MVSIVVILPLESVVILKVIFAPVAFVEYSASEILNVVLEPPAALIADLSISPFHAKEVGTPIDTHALAFCANGKRYGSVSFILKPLDTDLTTYWLLYLGSEEI